MVKVKDLAVKYGMSERKARRILRTQGIKKTKYHWTWREGSKTLAKVEGILSRF